MPLAAGTKLGPYEITAPIGKGGMGEVYRARDTKLGRDVAIKVLPEELAEDEERVARFEREAKLLASLNHPNIASIYGLEETDGPTALVLELVEGPTLAERIEEGPIPVDEALHIARQMADALDSGHEAGVVHRDLKPANVKLKEDGTVKVLDYGLAKALEGDATGGGDSELSQSPTLTRQGTQMGVILGTAAYMSPEQAKGKRVDERTDVWAFGAVVYEMLTGTRAFAGEDVSDTLAAVLRAEPDLDALPPETPAALRRTLQLCLTKDVKKRVRDIGDVRLALEGAFETEVVAADVPRGRRVWLVAALAALAGLTGGLAIRSASAPKATHTPMRLNLSVPPGLLSIDRAVAISRDGRRVAYATRDRIWIRDLERLDARPVPATEGGARPFFSPDGERLGFYARGKIYKVSLNGGAPVAVADLRAGDVPAGAWWDDDGGIVFGSWSGLQRASPSGGEPESLVPMDDSNLFLSDPQVLPGGSAVLYRRSEGISGKTQIVTRPLPTGEPRVLIEDGSNGRYLPTGHLLYIQGDTLFAVPFDPDDASPGGSPVPLVDGLRPARYGAHFDVSDSGTLVYLRGTARETGRLVWVDREGREEPLPLEPEELNVVNLSPDGKRVALDIRRGESRDVWLYELATGTLTRFTFDPAIDTDPVWSAEGQRIFFSSNRAGRRNVYWKPSDGSGQVVRLTEAEATQWPETASPDGAFLLIDELGENGMDIVEHDLRGPSEHDYFLRTDEVERLPAFSPDGRFVAYESDSVGERQVFVRTFPDGGGPWQISNEGGRSPRWSPDGREIFYVDGGALMAVTVETSNGVRILGARKLFEGPYKNNSHSYDVSRDGERFLMIQEVEPSSTDSSADLVIVLDWFEELKRLVPRTH